MARSACSRAALPVLLVLVASVYAQPAPPGVWLPGAVEEPHPWTHTNWGNAAARFRFAVMADRVGGERPGVFAAAIDRLNLMQPEFVLCVGDLVEGYSTDTTVVRGQWAELDGLVGRLEMPFFFVPGNHDVSNPVMVQEWQRRFGRLYYHFVYRDVLFLCLDTQDPAGANLSDEQLAYFRGALAEHRQVKWTLVFLHQPLWQDGEQGRWQELAALLQGRPHTVFAGHTHHYTQEQRDGADYLILATTGGVSNMRGPLYGEFDQVVWVTMDDQGPRIANLMVDGVQGKELRTAQAAAVVDGLVSGPLATPLPLFVTGARFAAGVTPLHVQNRAATAMRLTGAFTPTNQLAVDPPKVDLEVPARSTRTVPLKVRTWQGQTRVADLAPVPFSWTATVHGDSGAPVTLTGAAPLIVTQCLACPEGAVHRIDGDLVDWPRLGWECRQPAQVRADSLSWQGAADASLRFGVEATADQLWLAVEVRDDQVVADTLHLPWEQDAVEVRLDARPDPDRSAERGWNEDAYLLVAASPGSGPGDAVLFQRDRLAKLGVEVACRRQPGGYAAEIRIPTNWLNQQQGRPWSEFRLNISVDDVDQADGPVAQLCWQPDWRSSANVTGSGTFRRR